MKTMWLRLAGTSVLLAAAGALNIAASAQRWWPACGLGEFDSKRCVWLQDHLYDFALPTSPWVSLGEAAELQGFALLCLAAGFMLLPALLNPQSFKLVLTLAAVLVSAGVTAVAGMTWLSGRTDEVVLVPGWWVALLLWIVGPLAVILTTLALSPSAPARMRRVRVGLWGVVAGVVGSNPLGGALFFAPILLGYRSHDTTPWTEAVSGLFLIVVAVCLWPATNWGRSYRAETVDRVEASPDSLARN